jgi:hypothetical protein
MKYSDPLFEDDGGQSRELFSPVQGRSSQGAGAPAPPIAEGAGESAELLQQLQAIKAEAALRLDRAEERLRESNRRKDPSQK